MFSLQLYLMYNEFMKAIFGFKNSNIYYEGDKIKKMNLFLDKNIFSDIEIEDKDLLVLDDSLFVIPGLIDEHTHGNNGHDFMEGTEEAISIISNKAYEEGVTSLFATTMTMDLPSIERALRSIGKYINVNGTNSNISGIHLEGPFISKKYKGAQDENMILKPNIEMFKKLNAESCNNIKIVTCSFEEKYGGFAGFLNKSNIVGSIGHTSANAEQAKIAFNDGVHCSTHTCNAMTPIHHRDIGVTGEALLNDNVYTEIIADYRHVSKEMLKLIFKCKPIDKIVLITDSIMAKNMKDGIYSLGGQKVFLKDELPLLSDGTIAGSVLKLNKALKNIRDLNLGLSFEEIINLATSNPAHNLGIFDKVGSIKKGKNANLTIIDKDFNVYMTICNGDIKYINNDINNHIKMEKL